MRKTKLVLVSIMLVLSINLFGQKRQIIYRFPSAVSHKIDSLREKLDTENGPSHFCFVRLSFLGDTAYAKVHSLPKSNKAVKSLVKASNRYVQLDKTYLPLVFRTDFLYSNKINVVRRDGLTENHSYVGGGYYIKFTLFPEEISELLEVGVDQ